MQRESSTSGRLLALALVFGHLFVVALAWSPSLHQWLHGDAPEPDHECAVAAVLGGQVDIPATFAAPVLASLPPRFLPADAVPEPAAGDPPALTRERDPPRA